MSRLTDKEARFIAALRRRDEKAFSVLVLRFQDRVHNLVFRLLGSHEEARDVSQEVFVTVFEKIDHFRGESKLSTWIYRVASNHAKNRIKYLSRRKDRQQDSFDDMLTPPSSGRFSAAIGRPDEDAERSQLSAFIQASLRGLDDEQRLVVVLRDIEGQSYEAIADITGLNLGTVKSRLHRGRVRLKDALDDYRTGRAVLTGGS
ncbi:MAG: RNA polymerase sigma-70 factor (ECF subfamily) [Myxococcota bacterium]|jgi:RNA polymerase sigma-70 factor (ECF subfamily)